MTQTLFQNPRHETQRPVIPPPPSTRVRQTLSLPDGEPGVWVSETRDQFDDLTARTNANSPSEWVAELIEDLAETVRQEPDVIRPISVSLPLSALTDKRLPSLIQRAVRAQNMCPQEIMLEVQDASLVQASDEQWAVFDALRRLGFRFSLDARRSSEMPLNENLRPVIERLRVQEDELLAFEHLQNRAEIVSALGGDVIVDRAHWKYVDQLVEFGATHAIKLLADS